MVVPIRQTVFTFFISKVSKDLGEFRQCPHPIVLVMASYCAPRSSDDRLSLTRVVISTSTAASILADSYCLGQHFAHPSICRFTCMRRKSKTYQALGRAGQFLRTAFLAIAPLLNVTLGRQASKQSAQACLNIVRTTSHRSMPRIQEDGRRLRATATS